MKDVVKFDFRHNNIRSIPCFMKDFMFVKSSSRDIFDDIFMYNKITEIDENILNIVES
jgi:hypothetical protein